MKYIGESSNDDGGLFRDSITEFCLELQSKVLNLLIPCGNQAANLGDNRDAWVINPQATSKKHLRKFHFIGCLMGMSLRTGILLNFNLAPMVWKRLTGDEVTQKDIKDIDELYEGQL